MMKPILILSSILLLTVFFLGPALAQDLIVFPAKGQSEEQMEKDKYECYQWAKKQTGFDPMEITQATAPPPAQTAGSGGVLKGAAAGTILGAVGGKVAGESGSKGAKYGAAGGALLGGLSQSSKRREDERARQQWEQEQAQAYMAKRNHYNRAYAACLEGKGYTVK